MSKPRFLSTFLTNEQSCFVLWVPVWLGGGIWIYFSLPVEPQGLMLLFLGFGVLCGGGTYIWMRRCSHHARLIFASFSLLGLGFLLAWARTQRSHTFMLRKALPPITLEGTVKETEIGWSTGVTPRPRMRLVLETLQIIDAPYTYNLPKRVRLVLYKGFEKIQRGQCIRLRTKLLPLPGATWPGGYNFRQSLYFQGIGATGFALDTPDIIKPLPKRASLIAWVYNLRGKLTAFFHAKLPKPRSSIAAALITGEKMSLSPQVRDAFRRSGMAHLLAISGLHLSIIAGLIFFVVRRLCALIPGLALYVPLHRVAAFLTLWGSLFYLYLSGCGVPAQRAFFMVSLVMLAMILGQSFVTLRFVAFAAVLILAVSPEVLLGPSFQLSFAAVVALVSIYDIGKDLLGRPQQTSHWMMRVVLWVGGVALSSLIATLATMPYTISFFHNTSLQGLFSNMLAIPLTAFIVMPLGVVVVVLWGLGIGSSFFVTLWSTSLSWLLGIAQVTAAWPGSSIPVPAGFPAAIFLVTIGGLWLCLWKTRARWLGFFVYGVGVAALFIPHVPNLFVSADGRLVGVFDHQTKTLRVNTLRRCMFVRRSWEEATAAKVTRLFSDEATAKRGLTWVGQYHETRPNGMTLLIQGGEGEDRNTRSADFVVALTEPPYLRSGNVLSWNPWKAFHNGSLAVWISSSAQTWCMMTGRIREGRRPWSPWYGVGDHVKRPLINKSREKPYERWWQKTKAK